MNTLTITRKLEIDAGHRLMNHESKCRHAHGHRYVFEVEASAPTLDNIGRVIDFGELKKILGTWLDDHWDHAFIYQTGDPIGDWLNEHAQRSYPMPVPPTAENLSRHFLEKARFLMLGTGIEIVSVKLWETPNCYALAR